MRINKHQNITSPSCCSPAWKLWNAGWISGTRERPPADAAGKRARSAPLAAVFATRPSIVANTAHTRLLSYVPPSPQNTHTHTQTIQHETESLNVHAHDEWLCVETVALQLRRGGARRGGTSRAGGYHCSSSEYTLNETWHFEAL